MVFLVRGRLIAIRDPYGFRPLSIGRLGTSYVVASETCVFDLLGATHVRDIERGEVVVFDVAGEHSRKPFGQERSAKCFFEHVYFSRPDSMIFGESVQDMRKRLGRELYAEHPVDADVVIPVPDSGVFSALGYAQASGIDFDMGLVRNHYIGRTFIEPSQQIRNFGVRIKLNPVKSALRGRRVVLVDDSIVRGTTSKKIVQLCREAGVAEVHVRISCPPTTGPCYYGIDTPHREELIASRKSVEQIREFIDADSLGFLSIAGMMQATGKNTDDYCTACWDDEYPVRLPLAGASQMGLFEKTRR
jgi:amidophosphoribosyltransferase